ncbi:hypothetical protein V6N12_045416 [Hibiscus sabdariffa]|uniref:Uncharacterized protein n=1 Tax=Hibiscus sabdariffa TaxID=183260 RepID=A0ABR2G372_9ROSI
MLMNRNWLDISTDKGAGALAAGTSGTLEAGAEPSVLESGTDSPTIGVTSIVPDFGAGSSTKEGVEIKEGVGVEG